MRCLQFHAFPDDLPQFKVKFHGGAVLGKRINEGAYLAEYVRHAEIGKAWRRAIPKKEKRRMILPSLSNLQR